MSDNPKSFFNAYRAAFIWAAFILLLCALPGYDLPRVNFWDFDIGDKLAHVGVFTLLGFFMVKGGVRRQGKFSRLTPRRIFVLALIAAVYGGLTEIMQGLFFPTRFADVLDFIADSIGGIVGIIIGTIYFKYKAQS